MTKREALEIWRKHYLSGVQSTYEQDGVPDYPARSESWSFYTDGLCREGSITLCQYESWSAPRECGR